MAKLIHILAASVGGGLVLGASIRLGEAIGNKVQAGAVPGEDNAGQKGAPADRITTEYASRLDRVEQSLSHSMKPEATRRDAELESVLARVVSQMDRQQGEIETLREQFSEAMRDPESGAPQSISGLAEALREDVHRQIRADLDKRLAAVETRLQLS
jgi:hypothetical protein